MNYDLYAAYPCETEDDVRRIVGDHKGAPYTELRDIYTRVMLLAPSVVAQGKDYAKSGHFKFGGGYKGLVYDHQELNKYNIELIQPRLRAMSAVGLHPPEVKVEALPYLSFFLQVHLTLDTACTTGGMEALYIHEAPILKETNFKIPMMASSSWKGIFRTVARRLVGEGGDEERLLRLFGVERDKAGEGGNLMGLGRLRFYPTFFDKISLELINPHSRRTKSGTVPILLEVVPPGARGVLSLLYFPWDLIVAGDRARARREAKEDLEFVSRVLEEVLHVYGFSAKGTLGYGLAKRRYTRVTDQKTEEPGGLLEMSGAPIYKEGVEASGPAPAADDWRTKLVQAQQQLSGGSGGEKDNTFEDYPGLERLVRQIGEALA